MLRKVSQRIQSEESGFTLIELLVVILIIGILFFFNDTATTEIYTLSLHDALPIYARNLVSQIEACFANEQDYSVCMPDTTTKNTADHPTPLDIGSTRLLEKKTASGKTGYTVTATSQSANVFTITQDPTTRANQPTF